MLDAAGDDPTVRGTRRFTELVAATRACGRPRSNPGSKGWDGFALVLVT